MEESERQEVRQLPVKISEDEFKDRAKELATIEEQLDKLDQQKKAAVEEFKRQKGTMLSRKHALVKAVKEGIEDRDVDCEWQENFKQKCHQLVRLDNKEVVDNMAMTAVDLQGKLPGTEGDKDKGKGKGKKDGKDKDHKDPKHDKDDKGGKGDKKPRSRKSGKKDGDSDGK